MNRIFIDNEEVVCDSSYKIEEELKNPSSIILDKVYPKKWKGTNKLLTDFYFPKDYSKCLIKDVTNIPAEEGEYATGTDLNINVDNTKEWDYKLLGDTQQVSLPTEYTAVDYIEGHRAEYIDTGFKTTPKTRVEATFQFTQVTPTQQRIFGNAYSETDGLVFTTYINGGGNFAWACQNNTGNWVNTGITADTNKHTFIVDSLNNSVSIDNYSATITSTRTNNSINTMLLFSYRGNGVSPSDKSYLKMYSTKIYDNNVLVRDFIPCYRNSDNVVGMYDVVNNVFYTNQGTGAFTYGSVVDIPNPDYPQNINVVTGEQKITIRKSSLPIEYTQVDYIESSGTQYIDTGILPNSNIGFEIDFIPHNNFATSGARTIFGSRTTWKSNGYQLTTYTAGDLNGGHFLFGTNDTASLIRHSAYMQKDVRCQISFLNGIFKAANGNETNIQGTFSNVNKNIYLFGCIENSPLELSTTTLYKLKFYDNGNLVRDFIPCYRNSDKEVGLYDLVNNVFYINQGTGTFGYGYEENNSNNENKQIYPINLGKNLFDKDNANIINAYTDSTLVTSGTSSTFYIKCAPNTTYTVSRQLVGKRFQVAECSTSPTIGVALSNLVPSNFSNELSSITITTSSTAKYLCVFYSNVYGGLDNNNGYTEEEIRSSIQIEKGSTATDYAPYITPIELCKIGDYQDYIYENNGDWYLHKEIGKVILNGGSNETYGYQNNHRFWLYRSYWTNETVPKNPPNYWTKIGLFCNRFVERTAGETWADKEGISYDNPNTTSQPIGSTFNIACNSVATNVNDFKTWLSNNPLEVVYILQNSQDTQITDTTLIQQLDNLKNATLYNGVNNISVDGELPVILDLHYNYVTARTDEELIFAGIVKNSGNMVLDPRKPHYCSLQILDYSTFLSESDTLDFVINSKTIPEAIEQVVQSISSYGFILGNINIKDTTSIIGAYSTLDKTPYDVFEYLSEISESLWFTRMVDENTIAIDFYDIDYLPQNDDLEYTSDYFKNNKINDIQYDYSTNDYRNKQIIKSSQVYGNVDYIETIIANGYNKSFSTSNSIGIINSITVNGVEKSIGTEDDKEIGIEADFYYSAGTNTFENNENDTYTAGTQIIINYTPLIKGRELVSNNYEISRINNQTQRKGIITRYENRDDILSADELNKVAQSYIKTYSNPEIVLKLDSSSDFLTLGSKIKFNAPLEELSKEYLVKKKTTLIKQSGEFSLIKYQYELSSTFNLNNEINYFDNQRRKSEGNISNGEYITRNIDIEQTANIIWDNLTITEIVPTGDNVLNSPLNSPFIQ